MMRVIIFGQAAITEEASRHSVLCRAVERNANSVNYCTTSIGFARPDAPPYIKLSTAALFCPARWLFLTFKYFCQRNHDLIFLPYPSYMDGWLACILAKATGKTIISDAFLPLYDTLINDRKLFSPKGIVSKFIFQYERFFLNMSDRILVDTPQHKQLLKHLYNIKEGKLVSIPVGVEETLWKKLPPNKNSSPFRVLFWCTFIPLHGAETVADAAARLQASHQDIHFLVIGTGQEADKFKSHLAKLSLNNLTWIDRFIPLRKIYHQIKRSHCCLGVFGDTKKTDRVVPYKAYQTLACARPLITASTQASNALFTDRIDAFLIKPGDPEGLANAVEYLYNHRPKLKDIGERGRKLYEKKLSNSVINQKIKQLLETLSL